MLATSNVKGITSTREPKAVISYRGSQGKVRGSSINGAPWRGMLCGKPDRRPFEKGVTRTKAKKEIS